MEIGQVAIVLLVAPVVAWLHERRPRLAAPALTWGSATVIAAGALWLVRRVLSAT